MIDKIQDVLKQYWGYEAFLPLQKEAMQCVAEGRDSVVVLPTGGGKSLCFQAPALVLPGMAVVVSPLIALMKDQVDGLVECGVPAARLDSTQTSSERGDVYRRLQRGDVKILYLSPERLLVDGFMESLKRYRLSFVAIDEAHCISMWGHDFRPEYRQLGRLKEVFPDAAVHAYTATATSRVRDDVAGQLGLRDPAVLVGSFDRPNLVYSVERRAQRLAQVSAVLDRHKGESGIVYCIRRADVDDMCASLSAHGYSVAPYHAGLGDEERKRNQEAFIKDRVSAIVATIAFGMGIDKPNVRYVVHAGMPKSLEHYQQESGRAGRDGLEAECCLFFSPGDYGVWKSIVEGTEPEAAAVALAKLNDIYGYCTGITCRHRRILRYFGQDTESDNCGACDVCLGAIRCADDALVTSQKILSCVLRLRERFGAEYTALVLVGSEEKRLVENGHHTLSTYGILSNFSKRVVRDWIEQLVQQEYLVKTGEFNVLAVTPAGRDVLAGETTPRLLQPVEPAAKSKAAKPREASWEGVDAGLFGALKRLRREIADRNRVPAYIVFGDTALRDMARRKPRTRSDFLEVHGVGEHKCAQYADEFLRAIEDYGGSDETP